MPSCANSGYSSESWGKLTYLLDLETGLCEGTVINGEFSLVDPVWWKDHCAKVGEWIKEEAKKL